MAHRDPQPYLKYALFCRDTEEGPDDELILKDVVDLIELPSPEEDPAPDRPVVAEVDLHLAFCIDGAPLGEASYLHRFKAKERAPD